MDAQLHTMLFSQGLASITGAKSDAEMQKEARVVEIILKELGEDTPDLSSVDAIIDCFTGMDAVSWMNERGNDYHKALVGSWLKVPKQERDSLLRGVIEVMMKYSMFSISKPAFPILPAAIIAGLTQSGAESDPSSVKASFCKEEDYTTALMQVMCLWLNKLPPEKGNTPKSDELRKLYKECVTKQVPADL